ncbi:MAG: T9SS type A sorting domain-containing protein [Ignavibacteriaceae bacterium]|nr:T9SS type A sorting domain-containing protein [Ignavibacteriaceae bacterium]
MATAEYEGGLYVLGGIDSVDIAVDIVEEMVSQSTQVVNTGMGISEEYSLEQNYPDPFNPSTKIAYSIPSLSFVKLKVYNELGKEIKTLVDEEEPAGNYLVEFDGANLPSGTYFYQLIANNISETKKMILLK